MSDLNRPLSPKSLLLYNFRCYDQAEVIFPVGQPLCLRGANGSGKTTVLEALSMLAGGRGLRQAPPEQMARIGTEHLGWTVSVRSHSGPELRAAWTGTAGMRTFIDGQPKKQQAPVCRVLWLGPEHDRLFVNGKEARRSFMGRAAEVIVPGYREAALSYGRDLRERLQILKQGADARWLDLLETRAAAAGAVMFPALEQLCEQMQSFAYAPRVAMTGTMAELCKGADAETLRLTLLREWQAARESDRAAQMTRFGVHRVGYAIYDGERTAETLSSGEQKMLLLRWFTALVQAAEQQGKPVLPLIDDLNAYLDRQRADEALAFVSLHLPTAALSFCARE